MTKSRYSDEQIVRISQEADKDAVPEATNQHRVSKQSIYGWRKRCTGMAVDEVKELKNLTQKKARLKKPQAEDLLHAKYLPQKNRLGPLVSGIRNGTKTQFRSK